MTREIAPLFRPVDVEETIRLDKLDREEETLPWHPREAYFAMPKGFGAVDSDELMEVAMHLDCSEYAPDLLVAGSAMIESRLFSPYRSEETAENDEFIVQYGSHLLQRAADAHWFDLERGFRHYNDQTEAIRAEVKAAFAPVYLGILRGEVTHDAREQTYSRLAHWGRYIVGLGDQYGSYGLAYEIATLLGGLTDDEIILLPATPRGDSGMHRQDTTHDFTYVTLEDGAIHGAVALELKNDADEDRRMEAARRYDRRQVVVLDANKDLQLYKGELTALFGQRSLTQAARRNLSGIRNGLYARTQEALRQHSGVYKQKASA